MVKLFIFSLLALLLALLVTVVFDLPNDPGYFLIAFGDYTFETSLVALVAAVLVLYFLFKALSLLLVWLNPWLLIRYGRNFRMQRKANARSKSLEGLLYFTRRNWRSSYNLLSKSYKDPDVTVVNYLAAAYSAHALGDKNVWVDCLETAEKEFPAARSTVNYLRAQLFFKSNQLEQCLAVLESLRKNSVNDASLLLMLKEVYIKLEDWEKLEHLMPTLEKLKLIDTQEQERVNKRIFMERLYKIGRVEGDDASEENANAALHAFWRSAPAAFKKDPTILRHYVELLLSKNILDAAGKVIEAALAKGWDDELIARYGREDFGKHSQRLIIAEGWLKERPANAVLLLALGRICMRNQLWGKARSYFEASLKIAPVAEVYGELGRLLKHLGEEALAQVYFDKYSAAVESSLPDLPMPTS